MTDHFTLLIIYLLVLLWHIAQHEAIACEGLTSLTSSKSSLDLHCVEGS